MDKNPPTYGVPRQQTSEDRNGGGKEVDKETGKSGGRRVSSEENIDITP